MCPPHLPLNYHGRDCWLVGTRPPPVTCPLTTSCKPCSPALRARSTRMHPSTPADPSRTTGGCIHHHCLAFPRTCSCVHITRWSTVRCMLICPPPTFIFCVASGVICSYDCDVCVVALPPRDINNFNVVIVCAPPGCFVSVSCLPDALSCAVRTHICATSDECVQASVCIRCLEGLHGALSGAALFGSGCGP
jgi:hypothetical protein